MLTLTDSSDFESLELLATKLTNRVFEKLHVHLEPDGLDVPALFSAEHISRTSYVKVAHGNLEAAAQLTVLLESLQSFPRIIGQSAQCARAKHPLVPRRFR